MGNGLRTFRIGRPPVWIERKGAHMTRLVYQPLAVFLSLALLMPVGLVADEKDSKVVTNDPALAGGQPVTNDKDAKTEADKDKDKKPKKVDSKKDPDEIGNRDVGRGVNFYSLEKEIAMGKQYAQEIERQAKIVDDPVVSEYVNRVGQNLVRNSDVKVPVTIKVIDAEDVNAFALPGGFFFVNTGLVLRAETEAELAGVMAHEIAHIAGRHGTRQATRGQLANLMTIPLIFMGGWTGYGIRQAASVALPIGFLKFSRGFEREADLLGLQYLYKAGYDPQAFVDFFEKLQSDEKRKPGTMAKVFSSHPLTDDRIGTAQENIQEILKAKPEYVVTTSEFNNVKMRLASLLNRRKGDDKDANKPRLRKTGSGRVDSEGNEKPKAEDEEERPTLKRRN
jgi:predicted Zn-dependent protease